MPYVITPSVFPNTGTIQWYWVDPKGVVHNFTRDTSLHMFVYKGSKGLGSAEIQLEIEKLPFAQGGVVRYARTNARKIELPIVLMYDSIEDLMLYAELMRGWFDTGSEEYLTPGILRVVRPDGNTRQISCYYAGGLEGDMSEGSPDWYPLVMSLIAPDPAWTDETPTEVEYTQANLSTDISIMNVGDYNAFPIWSIVGPGADITFQNHTTGKQFALQGDGGLILGVGDSLVVDTRPSHLRTTRAVFDGTGMDRYSNLNVGASLWHFASGQNDIRIEMTGSSIETSINLSYSPRYRGLLR